MAKHYKRDSRSKTGRPKGSYLLPNGDYVVVGNGSGKIRVRGVRKMNPDAVKLAQAFILLAEQMCESGPVHEVDQDAQLV